jgi:hypothetical protein
VGGLLGKGGAKVEITQYFMSIHYGICTGFDVFRRIIIKEKVAWEGEVTAKTAIAIDEKDLFGGDKKEGGVRGTCWLLPGDSAQILPDVLAQRLGRANGLDCPGFRGKASAFFIGSSPRGFYWTANVPYLSGTWIEGTRAPKGLNPAYALVPRSYAVSTEREYETVTTGVAGAFAFSPGGAILAIHSQVGSQIEWWNTETRELIALSPFPNIATSSSSIASLAHDGTAYNCGVQFNDPELGVNTFLVVTPPGGTPVRHIFTGATTYEFVETTVLESGSELRAYTSYDPENAGYVLGSVPTADTQSGRAFCIDGSGDFWGLFQPVGASSDFTLRNLSTGDSYTFVGSVARGASNEPRFQHVEAAGQFFVISDGYMYLIDDASMTVTSSGVFTAAVKLNPQDPAIATAWEIASGTMKEYSLLDGALLQTLTRSEWLSFSSAQAGYDPYNGNFWFDVATGTDMHVLLRTLSDAPDANPAHMIYECLTNTDWGMGSPSTAIDEDSFEECGVTLFDDRFGLSMIWTRQAPIEKFVQEILDHIQAVLFVDPATGLLTLKLIRDDYDVEDLPDINPSNAELANFGRKLWGEIVNEITVTWKNPVNEQDETITVQDLGSIVTQGGIVSDGRNYYGVRWADLAKRLAARDLRASGAPLAACDAEIDRSLWRVRPASVMTLTWPEHGLAGVVMRVVDVDYGKPGDATIKVSLMEDVYGLDAGDYVAPPVTQWTDPSADPEPVDAAQIFTLPLFLAVAAGADVSSAAYPEVLAGVLASTDETDTWSVELWDELAQSDSSLAWERLTDLTVIGRGLLADALVAEATSTIATPDSYVGETSPEQAGLAIIGEGEEDEVEIALVTGVGSMISLNRGVLDTVPRAWPDATPIWFLDDEAIINDPLARSSGEVVSYKLRPRTSQGLLHLASASLESATLTDRPWMPLRPADVLAYGEGFSSLAVPIDAIARPDPWVTVEWANRNRLLEDTQVLSWTDATVTPETGQTTTITVLTSDGLSTLATHAALTGTSFDVPNASFGAEEVVIIRVGSERTDADGTFESLQSFDHFVQVSSASSAVLATSGFAAQRPSTAGSAGGVVDGYTTEDWDLGGGFNPTTGEWTAPAGGIAWLAWAGFPTGGLAAPTEWQLHLENGSGVRFEGCLTRNYDGSFGHGDTNYGCLAKQVTAADVLRIKQIGDLAEDAVFSGFIIPSRTVAFSGYLEGMGAAATSGDITGYTQDLDIGADFDPALGTFTVPDTGYYLIGFHGFPAGATSGSYDARLLINGVASIILAQTGGSAKGMSLGHTVLLSLTAGDVLKYYQTNRQLEWVRFSGLKIDPEYAFAARKAVASGSAGATITGWTEDFDVGAAFDATTGIFTAPETGYYHFMAFGHDNPQTAAGSESDINVLLNGANVPGRTRWSRHFLTGGAHSSPHGIGYVLQMDAGDTLALQQVGMTAEKCFFAAHKIAD